MLWCKQAQNKRADRPDGDQKSAQHHMPLYKDRMTNIWTREKSTNVIHIISNERKTNPSWTGHINHLKYDRWSPHGDHTIRKDDKGDQPSGGETTWTHSGGTRSGRGHRNLLTTRHYACPMMMMTRDWRQCTAASTPIECLACTKYRAEQQPKLVLGLSTPTDCLAQVEKYRAAKLPKLIYTLSK